MFRLVRKFFNRVVYLAPVKLQAHTYQTLQNANEDRGNLNAAAKQAGANM